MKTINYNGIKIKISSEFFHDINSQYGIDYERIIEDIYRKEVAKIRDQRIDMILNQ